MIQAKNSQMIKIDTIQNKLVESQKEIVELLHIQMGMRNNQTVEIQELLKNKIKKIREIVNYLDKNIQDINQYHHYDNMKMISNRDQLQFQQYMQTYPISVSNYNRYEYLKEINLKVIMLRDLDFKVSKIKQIFRENLQIYCIQNQDQQSYFFIWKSFFFVQITYTNLKRQINNENNENKRLVEINQVSCCQIQDQSILNIDPRNLNDENTQFWIKFKQFLKLQPFNSLLYQKINFYIKEVIFNNIYDLDLPQIFKEILNEYQNIMNPRIAICKECNNHLQFESIKTGFFPPFIIQLDKKFYHKKCLD